jgi:hypothetical protein
MKPDVLHITSGDCAGSLLEKAELEGHVFVWHDILYDGPRQPGWPDHVLLKKRARFLENETAGGLDYTTIMDTLTCQYKLLTDSQMYDRIVLWFDACLFDLSMLLHILTCLRQVRSAGVELILVDHFEGVEPFDGLGQLTPEQLAGLYTQRVSVSSEIFEYANLVDDALACKNQERIRALSQQQQAPLCGTPEAMGRWLAELPEGEWQLGRLQRLALEAIRLGNSKPVDIYNAVSAADSHPQFWGDTTLWARINDMAAQDNPLIFIQGPASRLPQWSGQGELADFCVMAC